LRALGDSYAWQNIYRQSLVYIGLNTLAGIGGFLQIVDFEHEDIANIRLNTLAGIGGFLQEGQPAEQVEQPVTETMTDEGKFKPARPSSFAEMPDETELEITDQDVYQALAAWNATMPPDYWGILQAQILTSQNGE
jgi:hypothetical protein